MSTLAVTNLKHESATGNNIVLDSSGNVAFADGSASAPSITNDGDTNTGIYFPAADNIGFATGGTIRGRWTTDGLCFGSDTAAANALDDYEEGTWTPSYSAAFTGTYSANGQVGRYTKVGRLVTAYFFVQVSTVTGSGAIQLNGLPFATASATNYNPGGVIFLAGNWGTNTPFSVDANGSATTTYNIKYRTNANGSIDAGNIAVSDLSANAFMRATIVYEV